MEDLHFNDDQQSGSSDYVMEEDHSFTENRSSYHDNEEDSTSSSAGDYDDGENDEDDHTGPEDDIYITEDHDDEEFGLHNGDMSSQEIQRGERSLTVQGFLSNLAQSLNENASAGRNRHRQGAMNLSEVFPEILSVLNEGNQNGQQGRAGRHERIQRLVSNVANAADDPYIAMESLRELSEHLLMMDQVIIERIFPVDKLVSSIVELISNPNLKNELELQLLSCRCLYNLFEISPETMTVAVNQNVIPTLQELLQEISYIDLAEQVLETLELISRVHPKDILRSGSLPSVLQYLDFFTIHAQRKAVGIVSNACSRVQQQDFESIKELLNLLKPIFINAEDSTLIVKLLNSLYGMCGGLRRDYMLEPLFTVDIVARILQLVASSDTQLDTKLKCLEIVTVLINISGRIAQEVIDNCDIAKVLSECFNCYSKSIDAALHETLMFVPKPLLHSIARTISVLFPAEHEQILSVDTAKGEAGLKINSDNLDKLLKDLTPLMVEIYVNAVDFDVRRYVLIALARMSSRLTSTTVASVDGHIIRLASSALAQNQSLLEKENGQLLVAVALIAGVLSLLDVLSARFATEVLPKLKREGIFSLLQTLQSTLERWEEEGDTIFTDSKESTDDTSVIDEFSNDEEEDDGASLQFGIIDIPDQAEPKKIKFNILKPLTLSYAFKKMSGLSKNLLLLSQENEQAVIEELGEIEEVVKHLDSLSATSFTTEMWSGLWNAVKGCIFSGSFEISSFEFVSTGLATALARIVDDHGFQSVGPKRAFNEVFGPNTSKFVEILQSALTRIESFDIVECGLNGDEGRVASLGKQVKIKLVYDGDAQKDNVPDHMTNITISIHCISSFNSLNEFLRHRMAQARFLHSLFPNSSGSGERDAIDGVKNWMFEFYGDDEKYDLTETVFGAIYKASKINGASLSDIWHTVQIIKFKRSDSYEHEGSTRVASIYGHQEDFEEKSFTPAKNILTLLKFAKTKDHADDIFINAKLSAKLSRQLEEPLVIASGILPAWSLQLTKEYNFIFPLETRLFFLQCTSFGYGRLVQMWKNRVESLKESATGETLQHLGRITRHKLKISRDTMFLSGLKILDKYGASPSVLEIEYQGEVGTGLGPTLEFYALTSREFTKANLRMWRCEDYGGEKEDQYVTNPLFPAPLDLSKDNTRILELFRYLGIFVARSMLDNRILDFWFSSPFFEIAHKLCRSKGNDKKIEDLEEKLELLAPIDPHLAKSLRYLCSQKDGTSELEHMSLSFTLPGYDIELVENGRQVHVTASNVKEYVNRVLDYSLHDGIERQLKSFIEGVSSVFPYSSLLLLTPDELVEMHGRVEEDWSPQTLYASINADHGYSMASATIHELIAIMSSFKTADRRLFLQFLTGSPKLPVGGFKSLKPKLTVVLKHPEDGLDPDAYLPSVMTCANYFKLPKYSSQEMMRSRIVQAMNEGSSAFLLS